MQLPEGMAEVQLPQPLELDAGAVGSYVSDYDGDSSRISRPDAGSRSTS